MSSETIDGATNLFLARIFSQYGHRKHRNDLNWFATVRFLSQSHILIISFIICIGLTKTSILMSAVESLLLIGIATSFDCKCGSCN